MEIGKRKGFEIYLPFNLLIFNFTTIVRLKT